jgi:K(+)-stimulated pyrophosphate-energized sodium pump
MRKEDIMGFVLSKEHQMAQTLFRDFAEEEVRGITDRLDAVGNTTAAVGKGLAISPAALTALALFVSYASATRLEKIDIMDARVIVGLFIGGALPFIFSALSIQAVNRAAERMIEKVRPQFREIPGIMDGTARPQYELCDAQMMVIRVSAI